MRAHRLANSTERGVVLFVAVIALVIMSLVGLALMRQMGSGVSIAGNVAFKENATSVADRGVEEARTWILANQNQLNADQLGVAYSSTWGTIADPTQYDWGNARLVPLNPEADPATGTGNEIRYVIHRLCAASGPPNSFGQNCSDGPPLNSGSSMSGGSYGTPNWTVPPVPFYRVTAQVRGPRNTVSYVQVIMGK